MNFTCKASVAVPAASVDLGDWIFGMSDAEYQACAKGHRVMGIDGGAARTGIVNVEQMAGILIDQHYKTQRVEPHHVQFLSESSQGFMLHLTPFPMRVNWEMQLQAAPESTSILICTIGFEIPTWVTVIGATIRANAQVHQHLIEETRGFARDLMWKSGSAARGH